MLRKWLLQRLPIGITWVNVSNEIGLRNTRLIEVRESALGMEITVGISPPLTLDRVAAASDLIAVAYGLARVRVFGDDTRADVVRIMLDWHCSLGSVLYPRGSREVEIPSDPKSNFPIGLDDNGLIVSTGIIGKSVLLGGNPGSGKSNAIRVFLAGLSNSRNLALYGIDPKRTELSMWRDRFTDLVLGHDAKSTESILSHLLDEVHRRAEYLSFSGSATLEPSWEFPAIVLVIDEWAELAADGTSKDRQNVDKLLRRFVSLGRAVGCQAILCTQRPTSDVIDTGTRVLLSDRFALRCGDRYQADAILGIGSYEPAQLLGAAPGSALWSSGGPAKPIQFFEIPDAMVPFLVMPGYRPRCGVGIL